jgi:Asp-tRNA(Asn)/Glu-tRNA(Gln) amidotransferase A subunit family amidase
VRITGAPETCRRKPEAVPNYLAGIDTCLFDASGNPTITLPCGFTDAGTPVAFQFVAPHFREETLFRAGYAYQRATDWHRHHPTLKA